ncbi:MAG: hypothetical protein M1825_001975 [Sarcosagium campestre]|nr:MAG: hypothetical protein M1825_001975 [Sarcosagium campestre]
MSVKVLGNCGNAIYRCAPKNAFFCEPVKQYLAPLAYRSFATEVPLSSISNQKASYKAPIAAAPYVPPSEVLTTIYAFPSMEPLRFEGYHPAHLNLPLRRDILHRAVIYEADMSRQGTASTKWRSEVHGSGKKVLPQKGTGRARAGDKKSPIRRGGGVAFGPKPRDFSSDLPRKIYDLAWRTALSYRYRKGELVVVEDGMNIENDEAALLRKILEHHHLGKTSGRSLLITSSYRENLHEAFQFASEHGRVLNQDDVDVKDLLELGKVVIEKSALDRILWEHESDLLKHQI